MKKYFGLILLVISSSAAYAQELDTASVDTVQLDLVDSIAPPKHDVGIYFVAGINLVPGPSGLSDVGMIGVGIKYDRLEAGFIMGTFMGTIQRRIVFPNPFSLDYEHGGGFLSYSMLNREWFAISLETVFQRGDMIWERLDTGEDFLRDTFNIYQFGIKLETGYLRYLRPNITMGYQVMSDIQLASVTKQDFSGFYIGIGLKVGYFNQ